MLNELILDLIFKITTSPPLSLIRNLKSISSTGGRGKDRCHCRFFKIKLFTNEPFHMSKTTAASRNGTFGEQEGRESTP